MSEESPPDPFEADDPDARARAERRRERAARRRSQGASPADRKSRLSLGERVSALRTNPPADSPPSHPPPSSPGGGADDAAGKPAPRGAFERVTDGFDRLRPSRRGVASPSSSAAGSGDERIPGAPAPDDRTSAGREEPSAEQQRPLGAGQAPSTGGQGPGTGDHDPITGDHAPITGDHAPITGDHAEITGERDPVTGDHAPITGDHDPITGDHDPITGDHPPITGEHDPVTGDHAPITGEAAPPPPRARRGGRPPSGGDVRKRRLAAAGAVIAVIAAGAFLLQAARGGGDPEPAPMVEESVPVFDLTIPEGYTREQVADLVRDERRVRGNYERATRNFPRGFNAGRYGAEDAENLEGFLFPATYELERRAPASALVERQLQAFEDNMAEINMRRARRANLSVYDVVIIASMIEREISVADERRLAAAVIYNRLADGEPLGIDATLRYELDNFEQPLLQSELDNPTPYNTRINAGLPPGPIGNPGRESLEAAANPANSDVRYYVIKPGTCNEHVFTDSAAEFEAAVAEYQAALQEQGGSPTEC